MSFGCQPAEHWCLSGAVGVCGMSVVYVEATVQIVLTVKGYHMAQRLSIRAAASALWKRIFANKTVQVCGAASGFGMHVLYVVDTTIV